MIKEKNIIDKLSGKTILVVGDIMLDRHIVGNVSRISPEAPVPVVLETSSSYAPGGAANVSHNLGALGVKVFQVGKIGNDFEGQLLKRELKRKKIDVSGIFVDKKVTTVTKTRVIAQHQQVVRIDRERVTNSDGDPDVNKKIIQFIEKQIKNIDAIIVSDYGKGLITPEVLTAVKDMAFTHKKILTVDPKVEHFGLYSGVTCITPNKNEAENAIRNIKIREGKGKRLGIDIDRITSVKIAEKVGKELINFLELDSLLLTLGEEGMLLFEAGEKPFRINTKAKEVFDVTGAGDAVISVFTAALSAGASKRQAADIANTAAGIVVGRMGAVAVTGEELRQALQVK